MEELIKRIKDLQEERSMNVLEAIKRESDEDFYFQQGIDFAFDRILEMIKEIRDSK